MNTKISTKTQDETLFTITYNADIQTEIQVSPFVEICIDDFIYDLSIEVMASSPKQAYWIAEQRLAECIELSHVEIEEVIDELGDTRFVNEYPNGRWIEI